MTHEDLLRTEEAIARVDKFLVISAGFGPNTAKEYGEIKNALRNKGCPTPEDDVQPAAITKQYRLTLVKRDEHF